MEIIYQPAKCGQSYPDDKLAVFTVADDISVAILVKNIQQVFVGNGQFRTIESDCHAKHLLRIVNNIAKVFFFECLVKFAGRRRLNFQKLQARHKTNTHIDVDAPQGQNFVNIAQIDFELILDESNFTTLKLLVGRHLGDVHISLSIDGVD